MGCRAVCGAVQRGMQGAWGCTRGVQGAWGARTWDARTWDAGSVGCTGVGCRAAWGAGQGGVHTHRMQGSVGCREWGVHTRGVQGSVGCTRMGCAHVGCRAVWDAGSVGCTRGVQGAWDARTWDVHTWGAGQCGMQGSVERRAVWGAHMWDAHTWSAGQCGVQAAWGAGTWGGQPRRGLGHKVAHSGPPRSSSASPCECYPRGVQIPLSKPLNSRGHEGRPWAHEEV